MLVNMGDPDAATNRLWLSAGLCSEIGSPPTTKVPSGMDLAREFPVRLNIACLLIWAIRPTNILGSRVSSRSSESSGLDSQWWCESFLH